MKNPFKRFRQKDPEQEITNEQAMQDSAPEIIEENTATVPPAPKEIPPDDFTEWRRTQIHGGIERRERNDIFEGYSIFGTNSKGELICRYFHRYPEHERDFELSYERRLSFEEFNRRLLGELDKSDLKLPDYNDCIAKAAALSRPDTQAAAPYEGFSDAEIASLRAFCDGIDTLKDKSYLHSDGIFSCECESVVGGERLIIRFRKPLSYDALCADIAGVHKESVEGYDIDDMWILSVYNRLRERCSACSISLLTSQWSLEHESVRIFSVENFDNIDGTILAAVAEADNFRRFGFYSLDFSGK